MMVIAIYVDFGHLSPDTAPNSEACQNNYLLGDTRSRLFLLLSFRYPGRMLVRANEFVIFEVYRASMTLIDDDALSHFEIRDESFERKENDPIHLFEV
jgi:hypothetical protein